MKVYLNGATHWAGQVPRIADGFRQLGHEVVTDISQADLVYSNNNHRFVLKPRYEGRLAPGAKVILTCLDVPVHLGAGFDFGALGLELKQGDAVCSISEFVQEQLRAIYGIESTVIFQPIKPVSRLGDLTRSLRTSFLHVGRRWDRNKRFDLAIRALQVLGYTEQDLLTVGNEQTWGIHAGTLDDKPLNIAYNKSDFVFTLGHLEGLSLPTLEAMAAGAVPIVCKDMTTRTELLPPDLFPEYEEIEPDPLSIARFIERYTCGNHDHSRSLPELKQRLHAHFEANWRERTSPAGVAQRILDVYKTLT